MPLIDAKCSPVDKGSCPYSSKQKQKQMLNKTPLSLFECFIVANLKFNYINVLKRSINRPMQPGHATLKVFLFSNGWL